jgi:hypothetical protein
MSTLAKVFVVFNLVLTLTYFGTSAALFYTRKNYLDIYEQAKVAHKAQVDNLETRFRLQKAQLDLTNRELAGLKATHAELAAKHNNLVTEKHNLDVKLDSKEQQVKSTADALSGANKTLQEQLATIQRTEQARDESKKQADEAVAAREKAIRDVTRLKIDYDKLNSEFVQVSQAKNDAEQKLEAHEIVLANLKQMHPELDLETASLTVPAIPGRIEAVRPEEKLVVLSVGKDQKVQEGYKFYVRRGPEFIGKVTVIKVYDDLSGARIEYLRDEKSGIQIGDQVNTTF